VALYTRDASLARLWAMNTWYSSAHAGYSCTISYNAQLRRLVSLSVEFMNQTSLNRDRLCLTSEYTCM